MTDWPATRCAILLLALPRCGNLTLFGLAVARRAHRRLWHTKSEKTAPGAISVMQIKSIFIAAVMDPDDTAGAFLCQKPESVEGFACGVLIETLFQFSF